MKRYKIPAVEVALIFILDELRRIHYGIDELLEVTNRARKEPENV